MTWVAAISTTDQQHVAGIWKNDPALSPRRPRSAFTEASAFVKTMADRSCITNALVERSHRDMKIFVFNLPQSNPQFRMLQSDNRPNLPLCIKLSAFEIFLRLAALR
jgi:hypothetical protein